MSKRTERTRLRETPFGETVAAMRPYVLPLLALTLGLLTLILAVNRIERYLYEDERFQMRSPELGAKGSPDLRIGGGERAPAQAIRAVFRADEGRSIFRIPIEERRKRIEEIKWVRRAAVSRVWPNRIDVRLEERVPVAFLQVSSLRRHDQPSRMSLIDSDGELLPMAPGVDYALPMLTGIREDQQVAARAARVRLMLRFLEELGPLGKTVSEVDVCREDNIRVVYPMEGRAITLSMGGDRFLPRLKRFLHYYPEIQKKMPDVAGLDLRLEDRITADERERRECDGER
jgi:cell division protein FtsQ